jgi:hypothetical protein
VGKLVFGLDLAGYSTGRSTLAAIEGSRGDATCHILAPSPFSQVRHSHRSLGDIAEIEGRTLARLAQLGSVAVDVPIDLQGLHRRFEDPIAANYVWQLYRRPIDRAFGAMPPLAERIGYPLLRFQAMFQIARKHYPELRLGAHIFETYPKASLELMNLPWKGYKGSRPAQRAACEKLCRKLRLRPVQRNHKLTDHEFDAILCALSLAAPGKGQLNGKSLEREISRRLGNQFDCVPPTGFVLLRNIPGEPKNLRISKPVNFEDWMEEHS